MAGTAVSGRRVWSAALMLKHLGHEAARADMLRAIETCMRDPATRTPDLGGEATTYQVTERLVDLVS